MSNVFTQAVAQTTRRAGPVSNITRSRHIQLHNVPKSAVPADIWRLCSRAKLENVETVDIDYDHLRPSGKAWITVTDPAFADSTLKKFHSGIYIGAFQINASQDARKSAEFVTRRRGEKGRAQAADRGVLNGSGPSGGTSGSDKNVCLSGFPDHIQPDFVKSFLKSFKLSVAGEKEVVKLDLLTKDAANSCSRFLIRLASPSEAHRLVRKLHETDWEETQKKRKWRLKAHIVY